MKRTSGSEHKYSPALNDNDSPLRSAWRRLGASQWVALIALTSLLGATTVHALTPREFQVSPDFDRQTEKLALAIMAFPCHESQEDNGTSAPIALAGDIATN
jgi:hypothetical protein